MKADQIDAVAFLEIGLGLARHYRGEMEDRVRSVLDQLAARVLGRNIECVGVDLAGETRRRVRLNDVDQSQLVDRLAVQSAVADKPLGQLASDHAGRASDENVHALLPNSSPLSCHCAGLPRNAKLEKIESTAITGGIRMRIS